MKKNEIYTGKVVCLDFPNKSRVEVEGEEERVLVKNALPGQEVSFRLKKAKKGRAVGNLLEVLKPSELENGEVKCPHFNQCGGCSYHTLSYENQKNLKLDQVQRLLKKVGRDIPLETIEPSPRIYEYRNKMEFSFGDATKGGDLTLGMHKKGSFYDIVSVPDCQIVDEDIRKILRATLQFCREKKLTFYHKITHNGFLRHLLVRKAYKTGEILVCLVTSSQWDPVNVEDSLKQEDPFGQEDPLEQKDSLRQVDLESLFEDFRDVIQNLVIEGEIAGILHMINDSLSDVVQSDSTRVLYGKDYFYEELLGLKFKISPFSFFQTNSAGAEVLYGVARDYIGDTADQTVFDLYSGTGTIAQIVAPKAKKAIGVEIVEEAVEAARENAKLNGLTNCEFIAGDVLKVMDDLKEKPDMIILDPPRDGVHPKAIQKIINYGVDRILYISCKPTSLARDLPEFLDAGYQVEKAVCVDMFPWTRGVESCVLLERVRS